jgi:hypothetical protein
VLITGTGPVTERLRVREIDDDEGRRLVRAVRRGSGSMVTWRLRPAPSQRLSWRYALWRTCRLVTGRSHRPRSTWPDQARLAFLAVTHRYKQTNCLWLEQFQIADYALGRRWLTMVTDSTQNIPFCAASRRHPTTVDGNDKIHLWHLTMYPSAAIGPTAAGPSGSARRQVGLADCELSS